VDKWLAWALLLFIFSGLVGAIIHHPTFIDDNNGFLKDFLDNDLLSVLGFITAVTLASAANIHLHLNQLQNDTGLPFNRARKSLGKSAYSLIFLFGAALVVVTIKPTLPSTPRWQAIANSAAILILYFNLSVLFDLTRATFRIPSSSSILEKRKQEKEKRKREQEQEQEQEQE
jgi:hypothetical protein